MPGEREREPDRSGPNVHRTMRQKMPLAARAAALLRLRDRDRAKPVAPLPLTEEERGHYGVADFSFDFAGAECFRGLSRMESIDYIDLLRIGLGNDDTAFLRMIMLGDRHAAAMRFTEDR